MLEKKDYPERKIKEGFSKNRYSLVMRGKMTAAVAGELKVDQKGGKDDDV